MNKLSLAVVLCLAWMCDAYGQSIKGYYVSKSDGQGTIYHTLPCSLFENREVGGLTFDLTYRDKLDGRAVLNFTYELPETLPADSVRFVSGSTVMRGKVEKIYISPEKKQWKHRYTFPVDVRLLEPFFNASSQPEVFLYCRGRTYVYKVKPSLWKTYAPIGNKIFEMIRVNEQH